MATDPLTKTLTDDLPPYEPQRIVDAVKSGELPEAVLDERVANILGILLKLPAFQGRKRDAIDRAFSVQMTRAIALEGAVLLKNENGALPLVDGSSSCDGHHLAVLGENANAPISTEATSAAVIPCSIRSWRPASIAAWAQRQIG